MNNIDFSKPGGLLFTQSTLDFMQREYVRMLNGIGSAWASSQGGQYVILSGCAADGNGNISSGICSVNGEMMYSPGGSGSYVRVVQTTQDAIFENGNVHPVYITRMLLFQEGDGQIPWSSFVGIPRMVKYSEMPKATAWKNFICGENWAEANASSQYRVNELGHLEIKISVIARKEIKPYTDAILFDAEDSSFIEKFAHRTHGAVGILTTGNSSEPVLFHADTTLLGIIVRRPTLSTIPSGSMVKTTATIFKN
jgi:hypothetical protein